MPKIIYVLSNTFGPVAVFDDEDLAAAILVSVADNENQQNNSIEEFVLNQAPDESELLA